MLILSPDLHLFETVADIGGIQFIDSDRRGIIRLNHNEGDAAILVVRSKLRDADAHTSARLANDCR